MKHITEVRVIIFEEDGNIETTTNLSSPTIALAIEKMGAWERAREREVADAFLQENRVISEEIGDSEKASDLQTDGVKIEE